jgi:hypothetical protein
MAIDFLRQEVSSLQCTVLYVSLYLYDYGTRAHHFPGLLNAAHAGGHAKEVTETKMKTTNESGGPAV